MRIGLKCVGLVAACAFAADAARGQVFTRIIGAGDLAPGTVYPLIGLDEAAGLDGDHVAFIGFHQEPAGPVSAVYSNASGTLSEVVRTGDTMPTEGVPFEFLIRLAVDGDDIAIFGANYSGGTARTGLYSNSSGTLRELVDRNDLIPGGSGFFTQIAGQDFSFGDGLVAFNGSGSNSQRGIYAINVATGGISLVADRSMAMPGNPGTNFTTFGSPGVRDGKVVFPGNAGISTQGIYRKDPALGGSLDRIVDTQTPIPGGGGATFGGFGGSFVDGNAVLFHTYAPSNQLWCDVGGNLVLMADGSDPVPGGSGTYADFRAYGLSNGTVVFDAYDFNTGVSAGIFANACGSFAKVLAPGDTLDGRTVIQIRMDEDSVDGTRIALIVTLTGTGQSLYMVDLTEFENYGTGYASPGQLVPTITGLGCGAVGSAVTVELRRGPDQGVGFLALGGAAANVPFSGGGTLLARADQLLPLVLNPPGSGNFSGWLDLPGVVHPSTSGMTFHLQALLMDPGLPGQRMLSDGLRLTVP